MIYIMILMFFITLFFAIRFYISKYSIIMSSMILSITGVIFSIMLFIAKSDKYFFVNSSFFRFDYYIFAKIANISISYYNIISFFNFFFVLYIATMLFFTYLYFRKDKMPSSFFKTKTSFIFLSLVFYFLFYSPNTSYRFYILINNAKYVTWYPIVKSIVYTTDALCYMLLVFYCISPVIYYIKHRKYTFSTFKKKQLAATAICLTILNMLCMLTLIFVPFRRPYFMQPPEALLNITFPYRISTSSFLLFMLAIPICISAFIYIEMRYKIISTSKFHNTKQLKKKYSYINKNQMNIFHSFKSVIFSYKVAIQKSLISNPHEAKQILTELEKEMGEFIESLNGTMNINNSIDIEFGSFDIIETLEECIKSVSSFKPFTIERNYAQDKIEIFADLFYLNDVFRNILQNALDAIDRSSVSEGKISLTVLTEYEWIIIQISDNGTGIKSKDIKNIFKPLYTTKSTAYNWGIGLSFVNKIIKMHNGHIHVQSEEGKGTDFTILLPKNLSNSI